MTNKQYANLNVGDLVTRTGGPNKGLVLKVLNKYSAFDGTPCLSAGVVNSQEEDSLYIQNKCMRGKGKICGAASCFKIVK